jgi:predicted RNase H-like HicB family nuclease
MRLTTAWLKWIDRAYNLRVNKEKEMKFKVVLEESEDGGYTVYVPSLPGCISEGETVEESMRNIEEAIQLYLEPVDDDFVFSEHALIQEIEL